MFAAPSRSSLSPPVAVQRLAVVRALQLGDMLVSIPALRAIRAMLPGARITLIGLPWARALLSHFPHYFDDFLEFPGLRGIPERDVVPERTAAFLEEARNHRFDLAVQAHGDGRLMNAFVRQFGARTVTGFTPAEAPETDASPFLAYPEGEPEVRRLLRLAEFIGAPFRGEHLEFPLSSQDRAEARALQTEHGLTPGTYAVVHPGGRGSDRRWSTEGFAFVADALASRGLRVVLTGTAEEAPLVDQVARSMRHAPARLAGRTSLGGVAALLRDARIVLCNDTGVSHLAAALRMPSVVIFAGSDPARWAPLDRQLHRAVVARTFGAERARPVAPVAAAALAEADDLLALPA